MSAHFFEAMADHMGAAYLRYSFTKGTEQEVEFLVEALGLRAGDRVLDVGCGPGRHAYALATRGIEVVGLDISARFVELARAGAPPGAAFVRADARHLATATELPGPPGGPPLLRLGVFDAAISLCQGAFGLVPGEDGEVLAGMARAVRPGGLVAVTGFSAYFAVRFLEEGESFDAATGVQHERATVRNEAGEEADFDAWTTCFTPRELRLLAERAGLVVRHLWSVAPGAYRRDQPNLDSPEFLLLSERPGGTLARW